MNLAEALDIHARARPDHPAIVSGETSIDYASLARLVRETACRLVEYGLSQGEVVGVCLKDSIDHLVANFALARIGAIILPMDWRWAEPEKASVAEHFRARLIISLPEQQPIADLPLTTLEQLPASTRKSEHPLPANADHLPLLLSLSSGTTGRPKGPCITHQQMLRRFWTHWINLGLNGTDRYVSATPLYFGGGRTFAMSVLFAGGTVILFPPPFDPAELSAELDRVSATSTFLVPTQLRGLIKAEPAQQASVRKLRLLISSGAPLDPHERRAIADKLNGNFVEYYASTEGGGVSLATPETRLQNANSVGRPVFGVEVQCVSDDHVPLPAGEVGQLRYRGPGVASKYFGAEDDGASPFRDGWFYPGDLALIDPHGHVELRGRRKDVIIRGGVNIYPAEIEQVLREHPRIAEAAVAGVASARLGETIAAFVVPREPVELVELKAWCAGRLATYKVPEAFTFLDELPRNSAGKVIKAALSLPQSG